MAPESLSVQVAASPELSLLLACARVEMRPRDLVAVNESIGHGVDWDRLIALAEHHHLIPLVHRHLANPAVNSAGLPASALADLGARAAASARRSLYLTGELVALLRAFGREQIAVLPLKGPVLAQMLYGSVALRTIGDLDLLVEEADVPRASLLLEALGYERICVGSAALEALGRDRRKDVAFVAPGKNYHIELHHRLVSIESGARRGTRLFTNRLQSVKIWGETVRVFPAEELLVYLARHGTSHLWERIEWICAIAELLRGDRIKDWSRVRNAAADAGSDRRLRAALQIAVELLDAPAPPDMLPIDESTRAAARSVAARIRVDPGHAPAALARFLFEVRLDTGLRARLHRCWTTLHSRTGADADALPLPRPLWPLYYLTRPPRLAVRYGRQLFWR